MPDEQLAFDAEMDDLKVDPYKWFMRNEPHLNLTPIETDPENGLRFTTRRIGMVRGMSEDAKKVLKVYLDPIPHVVLSQDIPLRGWYKGKYEHPAKRPRPCETDALLTQPYGGFCMVGCAFCYINHGMRGYRSQGIAVVDPKYPDKIAKQLKQMYLGTAVYMSSFIDPFLALEDVYHNTQRTSEAALSHGLPIFFLTRLTVPDWAIDHLKQNAHSYMQFSINTANADDWKRLSPRANPLDEQIAQVKKLHEAGIYVSIQVNPIVAGVTSNEDIVELIHMLAEAGADHLIFKFVEITYPSVSALVDQMVTRFGPERGKKFEDLFTCNIGGMRTIDEEYRKQALDYYSRECKKAGVTMSLCYEYEFERDDNKAIIRSRGRSMNPKYMTSDQCHGHRVPMYSRADLKEPFKPMDVCPPSGCLQCGDEVVFGDGAAEDKVPCGSKMLAEARALEPGNYKKWREPEGVKLRVIQ